MGLLNHLDGLCHQYQARQRVGQQQKVTQVQEDLKALSDQSARDYPPTVIEPLRAPVLAGVDPATEKDDDEREEEEHEMIGEDVRAAWLGRALDDVLAEGDYVHDPWRKTLRCALRSLAGLQGSLRLRDAGRWLGLDWTDRDVIDTNNDDELDEVVDKREDARAVVQAYGWERLFDSAEYVGSVHWESMAGCISESTILTRNGRVYEYQLAYPFEGPPWVTFLAGPDDPEAVDRAIGDVYENFRLAAGGCDVSLEGGFVEHARATLEWLGRAPWQDGRLAALLDDTNASGVGEWLAELTEEHLGEAAPDPHPLLEHLRSGKPRNAAEADLFWDVAERLGNAFWDVAKQPRWHAGPAATPATSRLWRCPPSRRCSGSCSGSRGSWPSCAAPCWT